MLVPGNNASYIKESLELMGIPSKNLIPFLQHKIYLADTLYLPSPNHCLLSSMVYLRAMRDFIHSIMEPIPGKYYYFYLLNLFIYPPIDNERTILVISRARNKRGRQVMNHDLIIDAIKETFPDEIIDEFGPNSDGSYDSLFVQWQRFHRAKIVIGPHGAAMANIVACQQDTKIVELTNHHAVNFFLEISGRLNLEHHLVKGWGVMSSKDSNFRVSIRRIRELLASLLANGFDYLRTLEYQDTGRMFYISPDEPWYRYSSHNNTWSNNEH